MQKEVERLQADAKQKKDNLLQVQSQVKDAEALASATRSEAEKLRKEAEDVQLQAATAASIKQAEEQQQQMQKAPPAPAPPNGYTTLPPASTPSYGQPMMQNQPPTSALDNPGFGVPQSYGMGAPSAPAQQPQYGGFNANVMGSGGVGIPTPSGGDDPYANPFG